MRIVVLLGLVAALAGCNANVRSQAPEAYEARSALFRKCSADADARDLHGHARYVFRDGCLREGLAAIQR